MSIGEIAAAAPDAAWRDEEVSRFSGRVFAIASTNPVMVAGVPFVIAARSDHYNHTLRFTASTRVADAFACERSGLDWLAAIEPQVGPFVDHSRLAPTRYGRQSGAWEAVSFGAGSGALVQARDDRHRPRKRKSFAKNPPPSLSVNAYRDATDLSIEAQVEFDDYRDLNCQTYLRMQRWSPLPEPQTLDATRAKFDSQPTIADRHFAIAGLEAPLASAIDVSFSCDVSRATGRTSNCSPSGSMPAPFPVEAAAKRHANAIAFDMTGFDRDDPQPMRTTLAIRLDPDDLRPIDFLGSALTPGTEVKLSRTGKREQVERFYPPRARREEAQGSVRAICQVQTDGSLICVATGANENPQNLEFEKAAVQIIGALYSVDPALASGAPSAGAVVAIPIEFRLE